MATASTPVRHQRISAREMRNFRGTNPESRAWEDLRKCTQAWDSEDSADSEELDLDEAWGGHCKLCEVQAEAPHLLLYTLHGRLVEPRILNPEMMPSVWSNLPQEVVERILAWLPVSSRFRFRVVSKGWRSFLSSASLKQLRAELGYQNEPLICAVEYQPGRLARCKPRASEIFHLCDSTELEPRKLDLSFLPLSFQGFAPSDCVVEDGLVCILKPLRGRSTMRISDSSDSEDGDALLDLTSEVVGMDFCVLNPMTRTWNVLPREFGPNDEYEEEPGKSWTVKLDVERNATGNFRVVVLSMRARKSGHCKTKLAATVYSSRSGCWKTAYLRKVSNLLPVTVDNPKWPQYVVSDGLLYAAEEDDLRVHCLDSDRLLRGYDWDNDTFVEELVNCHSELGEVHRLLGHRGRIFCVAQTDNQVFGIWKLKSDTLLWEQASLLPEHLHKALLEPPEKRPRRISNANMNNLQLSFQNATLAGDTVCLTVGVGPERSSTAWWKDLIAYHIPEGSWSLICHGLVPHRRSNVFHIFEPRVV